VGESVPRIVEDINHGNTVDFFVNTFMNQWRRLNKEARDAEEVIIKYGLSPEWLKGKTPEEIKDKIGEENFEIVNTCVIHAAERNAVNQEAKAITERVREKQKEDTDTSVKS
jgi:hypothetical protein